MIKISKKDFDQFLGSEPFYSEMDKKRFFRTVQNKKRNRDWFPKLLTAALITGLFVVTLQFFQYPQFLFQQDHRNADSILLGEKKWTVASSKKDVEAFFDQLVPGLNLAKDRGVVKEIEQRISLGDGVDLRIEEIWNTSEQLYIFYSIGVTDVEKWKNSHSIPVIEDIFLKRDSENAFYSQHVTMEPDLITPSNTIFYKNRMYHYLKAPALLSSEPLESVDTIGIVDISMDVFGEKVTVENVELPIYYDYFEEKESVVSQYIDRTLVGEGFRFDFERLDIRLTDTLLYTTVQTPEGTRVWEVEGRIEPYPGTEKDVQSFQVNLGQINQNWFTAELQPFQKIPDELTIHIDNVWIIGDDVLRFSINRTDIEKNVTDPESGSEPYHQFITEIKSTKVYLENFYRVEGGIMLVLQYEPTDVNTFVSLKKADLTTFDIEGDVIFPNVLSVTNEKGNRFDITYAGQYKDDEFYLFLDEKWLQESEQINVELKNLLYLLKVNQSLSFPVSKE
ncbi:hypothetical protein [Fervidibacillus halotolerans]|uniref:Uncharacterized protein n=1 Tax=Fervidibacillus halotolerans TaxID=2980027 RepID=A0A9E8LZI0_9BACI|nr:hypothetical protein [Fervidibacillus halotolerans]WAA12565.1 hypothetical protein OE105_13775 [Fervidibacillus halotolerans]